MSRTDSVSVCLRWLKRCSDVDQLLAAGGCGGGSSAASGGSSSIVAAVANHLLNRRVSRLPPVKRQISVSQPLAAAH